MSPSLQFCQESQAGSGIASSGELKYRGVLKCPVTKWRLFSLGKSHNRSLPVSPSFYRGQDRWPMVHHLAPLFPAICTLNRYARHIRFARLYKFLGFFRDCFFLMSGYFGIIYLTDCQSNLYRTQFSCKNRA